MSGVRVEAAPGRVSLAGSIDFDNARRALADVSACIADQRELTIDLGGIERSNSAGLALMIDWLAQARQRGHVVHFDNVPDGLGQLARVCQVESLLVS